MDSIMAKTEAAVPNIEIELYRPDESAGKYEAHVQALIAADGNRSEQDVKDGVHASVRVQFPKVEDGKPQIEKHKRWFRESAGNHDLSAKVVEETDKGDTIEFRYIVVDKIVRPRKPIAADSPESDEADVPEAVAA